LSSHIARKVVYTCWPGAVGHGHRGYVDWPTGSIIRAVIACP
jgi:hypothetical protein